eukprot:3059037-Pleurochrysis_carterae.AAC.1
MGGMMATTLPFSCCQRELWFLGSTKADLKKSAVIAPEMISNWYSCFSPPRLPASCRYSARCRPPSVGCKSAMRSQRP